jgi:lipoic acid synthetase
MSFVEEKQKRNRLPGHFKQTIIRSPKVEEVSGTLNRLLLHTVCEEAKCPNRNRCYSEGTATFLIMGDSCTRSCSFCAVSKKTPQKLDPQEPVAVAQAVKDLKLNYVVVTSVTRDDLEDGGAGHFVEVVEEIMNLNQAARIEVLTPDFGGNQESIDKVISAAPDVFNHNLETVERLYNTVRPQADYQRSLKLIERVARKGMTAKSGLMVGLGETIPEIKETMSHLTDSGCDIVTIGQYLAPSKLHHQVSRFWEPEEFEECRSYGQDVLGLKAVVAGPLVRSSYYAHQTYQMINN